MEKVISEVCNSEDHAELFRAVIEQIGGDWPEIYKYAEDYQNASGGISGFIYYCDTEKFARDNAAIINTVLWEFEEDCGTLTKDKNNPLNWMAWFAVEYIAGLIVDYKERD